MTYKKIRRRKMPYLCGFQKSVHLYEKHQKTPIFSVFALFFGVFLRAAKQNRTAPFIGLSRY